MEPTVCVYLPGGHLVWTRQESVTVLLLDVKAAKDPAAQTSHLGWAAAVPAIFVYLPDGHLVWARHHSKGQTVGKKMHMEIVCGLLPHYKVWRKFNR